MKFTIICKDSELDNDYRTKRTKPQEALEGVASADMIEDTHKLLEALQASVRRLKMENRAMSLVVQEEWLSNGQCFASMDSDFYFRQTFADDWTDGNKSTGELIKELRERNT